MRPKSAKSGTFTNVRPVKSSISGGMGLNSYNSLNRGNRIRNLAKIIDENKFLLDKL